MFRRFSSSNTRIRSLGVISLGIGCAGCLAWCFQQTKEKGVLRTSFLKLKEGENETGIFQNVVKCETNEQKTLKYVSFNAEALLTHLQSLTHSAWDARKLTKYIFRCGNWIYEYNLYLFCFAACNTKLQDLTLNTWHFFYPASKAGIDRWLVLMRGDYHSLVNTYSHEAVIKWAMLVWW